MFDTGFIAIEDCPGRGIYFDVYIGEWNEDIHNWRYDKTKKFKCVNWACDSSYPKKGKTGLGIWRSSEVHGKILEVASADVT